MSSPIKHLNSGEKDAPTEELGAGACGCKEALLACIWLAKAGAIPLRSSFVALSWTLTFQPKVYAIILETALVSTNSSFGTGQPLSN